MEFSFPAESLGARVSVKPPGSAVYFGECVLLQCTVESNCTFVKSYRWSRSKPLAAPDPRHLVSSDTYFITAVTREDADRYWCQAECQMNKTVFVVNALPVALNVSGEQQLLHPLQRGIRFLLHAQGNICKWKGFLVQYCLLMQRHT